MSFCSNVWVLAYLGVRYRQVACYFLLAVPKNVIKVLTF